MTFSDTKRLLGGVATQIGEKNLSLIAAGVAFFGMLALFPAMAAIIAIWGLMSDPHVLIEQLDLIRNLLPDEVVRLIENQINALSTASGDKLGLAGLIATALAIWSARSGVAALILGLNAIHGRKR